MQAIMENPKLDLARDFVLHTRKNIFLTGKAGTGKTTFLKNVLKSTDKECMIVAPTGVAAINAGGITIHSLFQFPLTAFTPDHKPVDLNLFTNQSELNKHIRYNRDKLNLLRQLDLLVIDEISMVRADLLDAIDYALRRTRQIDQPFGNVQLLVIGDLFQLAPILRPPIWDVLQTYYSSPYFFDALSWKDSDPITIELTKIYRQNNPEFIDILNRMRQGKSVPEDLERLNRNYDPNFTPGVEKYVTLSTHNSTVNKINGAKMKALETKPIAYKAVVEGTFSEHAYPADEFLTLKVGAQVMFIRNDPEGRFFNGKLAEVVNAYKDDIEVKMDDGTIMSVDRAEWPNKRYEVDPETGKIQEKELGSFAQYPLRLAWAITVHKSQGLTFDRMAVDLGKTFAYGQAYVALSRCTSLDGLVLLSKMEVKNVMASDKIVNYHDQAPQEDQLADVLRQAKIRFANEQLSESFDLSKVRFHLRDWLQALADVNIADKDKIEQMVKGLIAALEEIQDVSKKFRRQLSGLVIGYQKDERMKPLQERIEKAVHYFADQLFEKIVVIVHGHVEELAYKAKVRKYARMVGEVYDQIWIQLNQLREVSFMGMPMYSGAWKYDQSSLAKVESATNQKKQKKGATYDDTLVLIKKGLDIDQIAEVRGLKSSTIESHIAKLIAREDLSVFDFVDKEQVEKVIIFMAADENAKLTEVKKRVSFDISYGKLRMVKSHFSR
ncbi:MAG: AAA family ATPase [Saprospiraceae bacterium]|nr:AAA family ATPase [Saprospiraceae bacterium]